MPIKKVLELSTGHIPLDTNTALNAVASGEEVPFDYSEVSKPSLDDIAFAPYLDVGWIIAVQPEDPKVAAEAGHPAMGKVIQYAIDNGCDFVLLHADADYAVDHLGALVLEKFDW